MTPIEGINVLIQIYKLDDYHNYACATDISISRTMETKSVRTLRDGSNKKFKGQIKGYSISLSGLIVIDEDTLPAAFDLNDYHEQMVDVQYQILFEDPANGKVKVISGNALVTDVNMGAGADGFATGAFTLLGNGALAISDANANCLIRLTNIAETLTIVGGGQKVYSVVPTYTGGTPLHWEYSVNGGGRLTTYGNPFVIRVPLIGMSSVEIWPVCENGFDGTSFTTTVL